MKFIIFFLSFLIIPQYLIGQKRLGEPGKCYAKAYVDSKVNYEIHQETYPVFIGKENKELELKKMIFTISPPAKKWEKCKDVNNGIGNHSRVWCLVVDHEEHIEIEVVMDTSKTTEFIYETFEVYRNITFEHPENSSIWTEVICENQLVKRVLYKIQDALREEGFYNSKNIKYVNEELKTALINFQKSKNLPFGHFDKATLEALNIIFFK